MDDKEYFDWWRTAKMARNKYPVHRDWELVMQDMPFPLPSVPMMTYPGDQIRDRKLIEIFLNEFNKRHHAHMTVEEFLK